MPTGCQDSKPQNMAAQALDHPGDRVGVLLGPSPWCAAAHLAIWKIGAISVSLVKLFKRGAPRNRIGDSGLSLVLADVKGVRMLKAVDANLPGLRSVASGGESVRAKIPLCHRKAFGLNINEFYGQAEVNMMVSLRGVDFVARPGCISNKAYVMLKGGAARGVNALKQYVQERLVTCSYIIEISFIDALNMAVTAK